MDPEVSNTIPPIGTGSSGVAETAKALRLSTCKRASGTTENGRKTPSLRPPLTYGQCGGFYAGLLGLPLTSYLCKRANGTRENDGKTPSLRAPLTYGPCGGFYAGLLGLPLTRPGGHDDDNGHGFRGPSSPGFFL